jgi:hypothetical protein
LEEPVKLTCGTLSNDPDLVVSRSSTCNSAKEPFIGLASRWVSPPLNSPVLADFRLSYSRNSHLRPYNRFPSMAQLVVGRLSVDTLISSDLLEERIFDTRFLALRLVPGHLRFFV